MTRLRIFLSRLGNLFLKRRYEKELDEEIRCHLEMLTVENLRQGMSVEEARYAALRMFGGVEQVKERYRDRRRLPLVETTLQDLRYAVRMLLKTPAFTVVAVLTLSLGIGANTAIFSVVNAVLLRALPYHNPDSLILLNATTPTGDRDGVSVPETYEYQAQMRSVDELAFLQSQSINVTGGERPDRVRGAFVSANFFSVFHIPPIIGRTFVEGEDRKGAEKVVVVNQKLWQERLNGESNLEGKKLILNGEPYSVIGVVTSEFKQPFDPEVELWISMSNFPGNTAQRDTRFLYAVGHLKSESSVTQAQAEASTIAGQLEQAYPKENARRGAKVSYLKEVTVSFIRPTLLMLFAAVGVILLIACANLANLLLARSLTRQREIALRAALGASKWRLLRQLLTETTFLGLLGGVGGVLLAYWGLQALLKLPQNFVNTGEVRLDFKVLLFALGVSILTGWLFGLAPAVQLARADLHPTLKEGGRSTGGGAGWNRLRSGFVIVQVALSLILLITGGLLIRSFNRLLQVDVGFQPTNVLTLEYRLPRSKYQQSEAQWNFHRQVIERISEVPGVQSAALVRGVPFSGNSATTPIILPDREQPAQGKEPQAMFNTATASYFDTMGIPLIKGRLFTEQDRINTQTVFLINETMARRFWPDQDPIGKTIKLVDDTGTTGTIIGVVGDVKQIILEETAVPQIYSAYSQTPGIFATAVIRTAIEPMSLAEQVRQAVWKVDSDQPMWKIRTVEFLIDRNKADKQFVVILMSIFASLALILTVIGLYGVIGYTVNQRQQEIGIRMALGAQARNILAMMLRQGMILVLIGLTIGIIAAWLITRLLESSLYGVSTYDPITYVGITALLTAVALLACYLPARRATKVDPIVTLKYD